MVTSQAQLNSLMMQLQHQVALVKVTGSLERSTEIMKTVNGMVKLPEVGRSMQDLAKEMTKVGRDDYLQDKSMIVVRLTLSSFPGRGH